MIREAILSENDELLTSLFHWIKAELIYTFSEVQYEQLLQLRSSIHDEHAKASFIECIVAHESFVFSEELLKEYIQLFSIGATTELNAKPCLEDMTIMDSSYENLYLKLVELLEEEKAIRLLVMMPQVNPDSIPEQLHSFSEKLNTARRIQERSFMITSFLLIVHPQLNNYIDILDLSLVYPSAEIALQDWSIQTPASAQAIVDRKLVNRSEADVFLKLGQEYVKNGCIDVHVAKELYDSFFGQKSPIDVIFMLPS